MRARDYFLHQADEVNLLWKSMALFGVLLILTGLAILFFPAILVAMVAAGVLFVGLGFLGGALRLRRLQRHDKRFVDVHALEWRTARPPLKIEEGHENTHRLRRF